jgi:hypothetical protein
MNVYVASAWWRYSDPFVTIVGKTADAVEKAIHRVMKEEASEAVDSESYDSIDDALDEIAWSGVHPEKLETLTHSSEAESVKDTLKRSSVAYLEGF